MAKLRRVKRTYFSKKLGTYVTKEYTYGQGKSRRGLTLVGKSGRLNHKNIDKFVQSIDNNTLLNDAEKVTLKNELNALIKVRHENGKKLTTTGFYGWKEEKEINRLLTNAGYTAEELASEIGVTEEDILDAANWKKARDSEGNEIGQKYFEFDGVIYDIQFNYTSSILVKRGI